MSRKSYDQQYYNKSEDAPPEDDTAVPGRAQAVEYIEFFPVEGQLVGYLFWSGPGCHQANCNADDCTESPVNNSLHSIRLKPLHMAGHNLNIYLHQDTEYKS